MLSKKLKVIAALAIVIFMLGLSAGCATSPPVISPPIEADNPPPPVSNGSTAPSPTFTGEPPPDITWISPGKVNIGNFHPGARAEWNILIHNGQNAPASFEVKYREPNRAEEGYIKAPAIVQDWVIITDATPILMPRETRVVLVAIEMPDDAISPAPKWEFWVSVIDTSQSGMITTELCSRWCVQMKMD